MRDTGTNAEYGTREGEEKAKHGKTTGDVTLAEKEGTQRTHVRQEKDATDAERRDTSG